MGVRAIEDPAQQSFCGGPNPWTPTGSPPVPYSVVCRVDTRKLVCNKQKFVLLESILAVLSDIEINRLSWEQKKKLVLIEYPWYLSPL